MNLPKPIIIFLFLTASTVTTINAQDWNELRFAVNPKGFWYNSLSEDEGQTLGLELNLIDVKDIIYSIDYYAFEEFTLFEESEKFFQIGLMSGKCYGNKYLRLQLQGGLSIFSGRLKTDNIISEGTGAFGNDEYEREDFITCGLVGKVGLKFIPVKYISVGVDFQANINTKNIVYMPMISFEFGKLR